MNAKTIDEMHEELRKAGYDVGVSLVPPFARGIVTPDGFAWQEKGIMGDKKELYAEIVQKAWQHYQQQKQHAEMKALLEEMAMCYDAENLVSDLVVDAVNWMERAKTLLESMKG